MKPCDPIDFMDLVVLFFERNKHHIAYYEVKDLRETRFNDASIYIKFHDKKEEI